MDKNACECLIYYRKKSCPVETTQDFRMKHIFTYIEKKKNIFIKIVFLNAVFI